MSAALVLHQHIRAAIPNAQGISIGDWADRSTWRITPATLSVAEHEAAAAIFAAFDLAAANVPMPNWDQFITDSYTGCLAVATGTPAERLIEVSRRMDQYPSFVTAAQRENLALLQVVIARAHADYLLDASTGVSPAMEAAIRAAMVANHLVLP